MPDLHAHAAPHVPSLDALTLDLLTLEERADLERAVDGPITPAMIADKLRGRAVPAVDAGASPQYVRALIIWARADLQFYRRQIADLETEIADLIADRDSLYGAAERDRKTRHIAALNQQRGTLLQHCGTYQLIVRDAARRLMEVQDQTSE